MKEGETVNCMRIVGNYFCMVIIVTIIISTRFASAATSVRTVRLVASGTLGKAITDVINSIPNVQATLVPALKRAESNHEAAIEMIQEGKADLAVVRADSAYWFYNGVGTEKTSNLCGIAGLFTTDFIFTKNDLTVQKLSDLANRKIAFGYVGFNKSIVSEKNWQIVLESYGIEMRNVEFVVIPPGHSAEFFKSGRTNINVYGVSASAFLISPRHIAIEPEKAQEISKLYPFLVQRTLTGRYDSGQSGAFFTIGRKNLLIASSAVDDDLIYEITKAIMTNESRLKTAEPRQINSYIDLSQPLVGMSIPLHPGAARYFREAGFR